MNLSVYKTPEIETPFNYLSRWIGLSTENIFGLKSEGISFENTGTRFINGALGIEVDQSISLMINEGDLIEFIYNGESYSTKVESVSDIGGVWVIETAFPASIAIENTFKLISPNDFIIRLKCITENGFEAYDQRRLNANGEADFDLSEILRQFLVLPDQWDYLSEQFKEDDYSIKFQISYQTFTNGNPGDPISIGGPLWRGAISARQNLNQYNSNLIGYIPSGDPPALPLNSNGKIIPYFKGFPAWIDLILDPQASANPVLTIAGNDINLNQDQGAGIYRIKANPEWFIGSNERDQICTEINSDPIEPPPPVKKSQILYGFDFRGQSPSEGINPPPIPGDCNSFYLSDNTKTKIGYINIDTNHGPFTIAPGELVLFGLGANGRLACPASHIISIQDQTYPGGWRPVATSSNTGSPSDIAGTLRNFGPFDSSSFQNGNDGFISGVPICGTRKTELENHFSSSPFPVGSFFQYLGYKNESANPQIILLSQKLPPISEKYAGLGRVYAKRLCP